MLSATRIAELLQPFLEDATFPPALPDQLHVYLELLLRWNARTNLTSIRDPEQIVTRHFGESLFAARVLDDAGALRGTPTLSDIGSGPGFPGLPIKLFAPQVRLTLIESQNKKATFLREVLRSLKLSAAEVFCGRAESCSTTAEIVTLRAVEKFAAVLPTATALVAPGGILCLLLADSQIPAAAEGLGPNWELTTGYLLPASSSRRVVLARRAA